MRRFTNVLIVDDAAADRAVSLKYFHDVGAKDIFEAKDGFQALTVVRCMLRDLDLIQLDLNMPGMDGFEFLKEVRNLLYTGQLSIASSASELSLECAQTIGSAYGLDIIGSIQKPLTKRSLDALYLGSGEPVFSVPSGRHAPVTA